MSLEDPPDETWSSLSQGHGNLLGFLKLCLVHSCIPKGGRAQGCSLLGAACAGEDPSPDVTYAWALPFRSVLTEFITSGKTHPSSALMSTISLNDINKLPLL